MGKISRPRFGSLQFWPRKRVAKALPRVNWDPVKGEGFLGMISYKVGMGSAIVKDNTQSSMTKGKKVVLPVTILELPALRIYSVRFYKNGKVMKDVVVSNDKNLKREVSVPKNLKNFEEPQGWDDIRVIVYPVLKDMFKKTPDMAEVAVGASNKLEFVKGMIGKDIPINDLLKWKFIDVRGITKGKGFSGPVSRFGITLKAHKSEKGVRRPGSLAPWHPHRVTFRTPMAGQLGMFTRVHYNLPVIDVGSIQEKDINKPEGFKNYGKIRTNYAIVYGSVQGPAKRQILLTPALRAQKKTLKKSYELLELKL